MTSQCLEHDIGYLVDKTLLSKTYFPKKMKEHEKILFMKKSQELQLAELKKTNDEDIIYNNCV